MASAEQWDLSELDPWNILLETPPNYFGIDCDNISPSTFDLIPTDPSTIPGEIEIDRSMCSEGVKIYRQHSQSFGEIESRRLQLANLHPSTTYEELFVELTTIGGEIDTLDISNISHGTALVQFYDLRAAYRTRTSNVYLHGRHVIMSYSVSTSPNMSTPINNGTLVLFNLHKNVSDDQLLSTFEAFGEVKQIRGTPSRDTQKFVEYWDTRSATAAQKSLNYKYLFGRRICVEYSLPSGYRKNLEQLYDVRLPTIERRANHKAV